MSSLWVVGDLHGGDVVEKKLDAWERKRLGVGTLTGAVSGATIGGTLGPRGGIAGTLLGTTTGAGVATHTIGERRHRKKLLKLRERRAAVKKDSPSSPDVGMLRPLPGVRRKKRATP